MNIFDFVRIGERTTKIYGEKGATWQTPFDAVAHCHSEVSEVFGVLRNKNKEYGHIYDKSWYDKLAEEIADIMISAMTIWEIVPGTESVKLADAIEAKIAIVLKKAEKYKYEVDD